MAIHHLCRHTLYALKRCYELVQNYSQDMNFNYKYLMSMQTNHILRITNASIIEKTWNTIITDEKIVIPYNSEELNKLKHTATNKYNMIISGLLKEQLAIGPFNKMKYYMMQYNDMIKKGLKMLHSDNFLNFTLQQYNLSYERIEWY